MNDIIFLCPFCKQPLAIDSAAGGEKVPCSHCNQEINVPLSNAFGLHLCTICQSPISRQAQHCPHCGDPKVDIKKNLPKPFIIPSIFYFTATIYLLIGIIICLIVGNFVMNYLSDIQR